MINHLSEALLLEHTPLEQGYYWSACVATLAQPVKALVESPSGIQKLLVSSIADDNLSGSYPPSLVKFLRCQSTYNLEQMTHPATQFTHCPLLHGSPHVLVT